MNKIPKHILEKEFEETMDEAYGPGELLGVKIYSAARALKDYDPGMYQEWFLEWVNQEIKNRKLKENFAGEYFRI